LIALLVQLRGKTAAPDAVQVHPESQSRRQQTQQHTRDQDLGPDGHRPAFHGRVSSGGKGSTLPTKNRYDSAPTRHTAPAAASGIRNEPLVKTSITPVKVVIKMPARLPAKFWMPPMEA